MRSLAQSKSRVSRNSGFWSTLQYARKLKSQTRVEAQELSFRCEKSSYILSQIALIEPKINSQVFFTGTKNIKCSNNAELDLIKHRQENQLPPMWSYRQSLHGSHLLGNNRFQLTKRIFTNAAALFAWRRYFPRQRLVNSLTRYFTKKQKCCPGCSLSTRVFYAHLFPAPGFIVICLTMELCSKSLLP